MINYDLPEVNLGDIECSMVELQIIKAITHRTPDGRTILRGTRPRGADAAWVWRKVLQMVSPEEKFWVASKAFCDLPTDSDVGMLQSLAQRVISSIPTEKRIGEAEWITANG